MALVASSGVGPLAAKASGLRKAAIRPSCCRSRRPLKLGSRRSTRLGQHRMAEAIDRVRELRDDRRHRDRRRTPGWARRRDRRSAGWCARTPRTRDAGTASRCRTSPPGTGARRSTVAQRSRAGVVGSVATDVSSHSLRNARSLRRQHRVLGLLDQPVVLGVEDRVDRGQADVLVHAAVTGDVVRVEQLVVVRRLLPCARRNGVAHVGIGIGLQHAACDHWHGVVRDVDEERRGRCAPRS